MSEKNLLIEGARQNNLKNITLSLPHNKVIAITGVSGSGKSSLAFDTIFAEGQWRFKESLSTYARLFLEKLDRPDVDAIQNIRPAIALEQKNPVRGSRSTVGTLTELYDLFRLLYTKISTPFCPNCGKEIKIWDPSKAVSELIKQYQGERAVILFDRLVIKNEPRFSDSIEMAWREGQGKIKVIIINTQNTEYGTPPPSPSPLKGEGRGWGEALVSEGIITRHFSSEHACEE